MSRADELLHLAAHLWGSEVEQSDTQAWCVLRRVSDDEWGDEVPVAMVSIDERVEVGERELRGQIHRDGRWVGPDGSATDGFPIRDVTDLDRLVDLRDYDGTLSSRAWRQGVSQEAEHLLAEREIAVQGRDESVFIGSGSHPRGPLLTETIRLSLVDAGTRRQVAEALRADAAIDLQAWITAAVDAGIEKTEIARLAGVTRQTVYDMLGS